MTCWKHTSTLLFLCLANAAAQPHITSVSTVGVVDHQYGFARFSPDGQRILFTTLSYDGIWEYAPSTGKVRQLTADAGSGYNFSVSLDGKTLAYRRTIHGKTWRERKQEVLTMSMATGSSKVLGSARSLSTPAFDGNSPAFIQSGAVFNPAPSKTRVTLLGVEAGKIELIVNGRRRQLEPFEGGSSIWPSLSPDKKSILAYDMDRGAFVCDLSGKVLSRLGGLDGPTWTRDGAWIVAFDEVNDGHAVTASDLYAISPDGSGKVQITQSTDTIELYPSCSPTENKIVCHTLDGKILLMTYEVRP